MRPPGARPVNSNEWITVPTYTKCPRSFRSHLHKCSNHGINPYQSLQHQDCDPLKLFTLPNGETIQASPESIDTLTIFFSTATSRDDTHTFSKHNTHPNGYTSYVNQHQPYLSPVSTKNNLNNFPLKQSHQKKPSPSTTNNLQTGLTSCKNHRLQTIMKFTDAIKSIIASSNYKHSPYEKVLKLYKHILKLKLSPFKLVREADSLSHDDITAHITNIFSHASNVDGDELHDYTPFSQEQFSDIKEKGLHADFPLEALYDLPLDDVRSLIIRAYNESNTDYDIVFINTCSKPMLAIEVYDYISHLKSTSDFTHATMTSATKPIDSPNKKRKIVLLPPTDVIMESTNFPTVDPQTNQSLNPSVQDMYHLKYHDITKMPQLEMDKYLKAYASQYHLPTDDSWYSKTSLTDKRDQLVQATIELHSFTTPRTSFSALTNENIQNMDPILVYKELFQIELQQDNEYDIHMVLNMKHDAARSLLLSKVTTMETESTHHSPYDTTPTFEWYKNANTFILTDQSTDSDIKSALFADLIFQMRLREKTFQPHDRGELEDMRFVVLLDAVIATRDRIKRRYQTVNEAFITNPPSYYDEMDTTALTNELNKWKTHNPTLAVPPLVTNNEVRAFLLSHHPAWNSVTQKCTTLDEIRYPPTRKFTYFQYPSDEEGLAMYHLRLLTDDEITSMSKERVIWFLQVSNNYNKVIMELSDYTIQPLHDLQTTLKRVRTSELNKNLEEEKQYDKQHMSNLRDDQIEQLSTETLLQIAETYHRINDTTFQRSIYEAYNDFELKAKIIAHRDHIRITVSPDLTQKQSSILHIDDNTSNKQIEKLTRDEMLNTLLFHTESLYTHLSRTDCEKFSKQRLSSELKLIRNRFIKEARTRTHMIKQHVTLPPSSTLNTLPTPTLVTLPKGPSLFRKNASNLNGLDVSKYNPSRAPSAYDNEHAPDLDTTNKYKVVSMDSNIIYVRINVPIKQNNTHIPTVVKKIFQVLRQSDPSVLLLPFDKNNTSMNDAIEQETVIPDNENKIKKWVTGITTRNNRIRFTMRIQNNTDPGKFKAILSTWEREANSYIDFDNIMSTKVFSAGWLLFAHPRFLNRDELKEWIIAQADEGEIGTQIKLYARPIYSTDKDQAKKTKTTAVCIMGPLDQVDEFMDFIYNITWNSKYDGVHFIPFQLDDSFSEHDLRTAIRQHNNYLRSLDKEVITVKNPNNKFRLPDGRWTTILAWLEGHKINEEYLFTHVTQIGVNKILLGFKKVYSNDISDFISTLFLNFRTEHGDDTTIAVFGSADYSNIKNTATKTKLSYTNSLKKALYSNPQDCEMEQPNTIPNDDPLTPQHKTFFGRSPIMPTPENTETFVNVVKNIPSPVKSTHDTSDSFASMIKELREEHKKLATTVEATNKSIIDLTDHVNSELSIVREDIANVQKSTDETIREFIKAQNDINTSKDKKEEDFKTWLITSLGLQKQPPSGVEHSSARGGSQ